MDDETFHCLLKELHHKQKVVPSLPSGRPRTFSVAVFHIILGVLVCACVCGCCEIRKSKVLPVHSVNVYGGLNI